METKTFKDSEKKPLLKSVKVLSNVNFDGKTPPKRFLVHEISEIRSRADTLFNLSTSYESFFILRYESRNNRG